MNTSIQNAGAKQVKQMIDNKESLKSIIAFSIGFGFDINSYSSHVYIVGNKVSLKIRRECTYHYIN